MEIKKIDYQNQTISFDTEVQYNIDYSPFRYDNDFGETDYELTIDPSELLDWYFDKSWKAKKLIKEHYPKAYEEYNDNYNFMAALAIVKHCLKDRYFEEIITEIAQYEYENE